MKSIRNSRQIDAASMADIAFLLLIFFMMVTTINQDQGIMMKLPENIPSAPTPLHKRNVLEVLVNDKDELLVNNEYLALDQLQSKVYEHLANKGKDLNMSESPKKAIVFFKHTRACSYRIYIECHNEIKKAYSELRNDYSLVLTKGKYSYDELKEGAENDAQFNVLFERVKDSIPFTLQEDLPYALK